MVFPPKRRVQIYAAILGIVLLLLAYTLGKSAFAALHSFGFGGSWAPLLATVLVALGGVGVLIYAWRVAPLRLPQMPKMPPPGSAKRASGAGSPSSPAEPSGGQGS
jgi:hypothetical protein